MANRWLLVVCVGALAACPGTAPTGGSPPSPAGPGVLFTYPRDGQLDVPVGTRVVLRFSDPLAAASVSAQCVATDGGVAGGFCVEGPHGLLSGGVTVKGSTLTFAPPGGLEPGATYRVHARPSLVAGATNLPETAPLLSFRTRSARPLAGVAPAVVALNGVTLGADAGVPFLDVAPVRLLFSEPLDEGTVTPQSVQLVRTAPGPEAVVAATVLCRGTHLTVDPDDDLDATATYQLRLTGALRDVDGRPLAPWTVDLHPARAALPGGGLVDQQLEVAPVWQPGTTPPDSTLAAMPVNTNEAASPLIGANVLGVLGPGLRAQLGDPAAFGGPIPMVIRRGQRLDLSPLVIRFGGQLESGRQTGTMHLTFITDAVGFLTRSPLRPPSQLPDDRAPVSVDLMMDAALTSEDPAGNTMSTQTLMGVRLLGIATVDGDQLAVDQYGSLELSTLGVGTAAVNLALRLRTGAAVSATPLDAPRLVATTPAVGGTDVPPDLPIELVFSGPVDPGRVRPGAELTLTENGAPVPFSARAEGGSVLLRPARRLAPGAAIRASFTGLRSAFSQPVQTTAADPTGGTGAVTFTTAALSTQSPAPPILTAVTPGAPCSLVRGSPSSPGACAGGQSSDEGYLPFVLPANDDVQARFSQPIDPASLVLGAACGEGSVRVERLAAGACLGVVPGTLLPSDRGFRFVASEPWTPGATYRLTLVGGSDDTCGTPEICSRAGKPLNTDVLRGAGSGSGGGPNVVIDFTGAPAGEATWVPLESEPHADLNGNGLIDATETLHDENRIAMEVADTGGLITDASLNGPDCLPARSGQQSCTSLHAVLPVSVGRTLASCPIGPSGEPSTTAGPCVEVRTLPNLILKTSLSMNAEAIGFLPFDDLPTGMLVMRVREANGAPAVGYILRELGQAEPQYVVKQSVYVDAPDLKIAGGAVSHDLKSKPFDLTLKGPVRFLPDGRMQVSVRNLADATLRVDVSALLSGHIDLRIPAGEMHLTLVGPLLR